MAVTPTTITMFDMGVLVVIVFFICIGASRGFLREIGGLICCFASAIIGKMAMEPFGEFLWNFMDMQKVLMGYINEAVRRVNFTSVDSAKDTLLEAIERIPFMGGLSEGLVLDNDGLYTLLQEGMTTFRTSLASSLYMTIEPFAHKVMALAAFVVAFFICYILLSLIYGMFSRSITSLQLVKSLDIAMGGLVGLVKGCIVVCILFVVLYLMFSMGNSDQLSVLLSSKISELVGTFLDFGSIAPF